MTTNPKPEYGGECAFALSVGKRDVVGSAKHVIVDNGRTYHFNNGAARFLWKVMPNRAAKADAAWAETASS